MTPVPPPRLIQRVVYHNNPALTLARKVDCEKYNLLATCKCIRLCKTESREDEAARGRSAPLALPGPGPGKVAMSHRAAP